MLDDCNYSKVRLLHDLSKVAWYLDKHAIEDAEDTGHPACEELYEEIQADLEEHIDKLKETISGAAQDDAFE